MQANYPHHLSGELVANALGVGTALVYPETRLLQRLQAREEPTLTDFEQQYGAALKVLVRSLVPEPGMAQDVWQECLLRLWRAFPNYDASRGSLARWAWHICRNVTIDELRAVRWRDLRYTQPLELMAEVYTQPATGGFQPKHLGLLALAQQLGPPQQQVIDLLYGHDLTFEQTAQHLHLPVSTVKTRARAVYRVLRQLAA